MAKAKVVRQSVDENGKIIGNFHENPMCDKRVYERESLDGTIKEYAANIIAKNIFN